MESEQSAVLTLGSHAVLIVGLLAGGGQGEFQSQRQAKIWRSNSLINVWASLFILAGFDSSFLTLSCDCVNHKKETFNCPSCSASKETSLSSFGQLCDSQTCVVAALTLYRKTISSKGNRSVGEERAADHVFLVVLVADLSKVSDSLSLHPGIQVGLLQSA